MSSEFWECCQKLGVIKEGLVEMKLANKFFETGLIQFTAVAIQTSSLSLKHMEFLNSPGIQGIRGSQESDPPTPHPGRALALGSHFLHPELLPLLHTC